MSREEVVEGTAEAPCGRGVSLITSWEEVEVLPGANRPSWKRFLPRILSLETIPQMNSSVRACVRPWLESVKVLVLIISPVWVSKLPGMLGPL